MEVGPIPRTFWHAVSIALLVATGGLLYLAFRSQSVTIQTEKATIVFQRAAAEAADVKLLADELKSQSEALSAAGAELTAGYAELAELQKKLSSGGAHVEPAVLPKLPDLPKPEEFEKYSTRLEKASNNLDTAAQMKPWEQLSR